MKRYETPVVSEDLTAEAVQKEVNRILSSEKFARSKRLRSLLRFTVMQTLQGNAETLKEYVIGTEVLKKPDTYDPRRDSLVRVLASRLRLKLKEYYTDGGSQDPLVIEFPKGKYVPRFRRRENIQAETEKKFKARNAYSRGNFLAAKLTAPALAESAAEFTAAVDADPSWPAPHIALANVCAWQAFLGFERPRKMWPRARAAAESALCLDDMASEPHISIGMESAFSGWRWREAESHFQSAIDRDAYSGVAHLWRALACLAPMGRLAAARAELDRAGELTQSPFLDDARALCLYFEEDYEGVLRAGGSLRCFPWLPGAALSCLGRTEDALGQLTARYRENPRDGRIAAAIACACARAGRRDEAGRWLALLMQRRDEGGAANFDIAVVQDALGNANEALAFLQESLKEREPWLVFLTVDPRLRSVRGTPKFSALVNRIVLADSQISVPARVE